MNDLKIDLKNMHERDLHPFLVIYLSKVMNIHSKTIYHETSIKTSKGKSEWLHPDIVGFDLPVANLDEKVLELCGKFSISRATIYSFELKKIITVETLREQFFQTVSNSSWANEGYLVAVDINTDDLELMQEINRLSTAFGIGVIKLNLENPLLTKIIVPSKRKDVLDAETMNKLATINPDFKEFVQIVLKSININQVIYNGLDKVISLDSIKIPSFKNKKNEDDKSNRIYTDISKNITILNDSRFEFIDVSTSLDVTGRVPLFIKLNNQKKDVSSWKDIYLLLCDYLINIDKQKFIDMSNEVKGKKRLYLSKNKNDLRMPYYIKSIDLYLEVNLSSKSILNIMKSMIDFYCLDENILSIYIKK